MGCSVFQVQREIDPEPLDASSGTYTFRAARGGVPAKPAIADQWTFYGLQKQSAQALQDTAIAGQYVMRGVNLIDYRCQAWFRDLAAAQAKIKFTDDMLTAAGTLTAGALGLAGASAPAVGGVAVATGFGHALISSELANYIVAPDVSVVQSAIQQQMQSEHDRIFTLANSGQVTYPLAESALINYSTLCGHNAVKSFINNTVAQKGAQYSAPPSAPSPPPPAPTRGLSPRRMNTRDLGLGTNPLNLD